MARIETLHEFKLRTEWFSQDSLHFNNGTFIANGSLKSKVNEDGSLRNYVGNTIVFQLNDECRERLTDIQAQLYARSGQVLAEPLKSELFHVTLHDLKSGVPSPELYAQMEKCGELVNPLLNTIRDSGVVDIKMRATYLFNMVNTSVVLGLTPVDEENCRRLLMLYDLFQEIEMIRVPYPLTPHITMAYYKPLIFEQHQLEGLQKAIREVDREIRTLKPLDIELSTERLVYQTFTDMNHYHTVE